MRQQKELPACKLPSTVGHHGFALLRFVKGALFFFFFFLLGMVGTSWGMGSRERGLGRVTFTILPLPSRIPRLI